MNYSVRIKYTLFFVFSIFLSQNFAQKLTINVVSVPENTDSLDNIYLAGNFNNWNPGDPDFVLTKKENGTYFITFSPPVGNLQYKFTRGSWTSVEGGSQGEEIQNRTLLFTGEDQSVVVKILSWKDKGTGENTREENVMILDEEFLIPQLNRTRRIWIYLPMGYDTSETKYPVLYMQDGQNLFDKNTSFAGEWEVDETLNKLFQTGDKSVIVVGIDNGGLNRINEYSPWVNTQYGGGQGDNYSRFIVETLKPYIDSHFRTKPDRINTGIMGSSLGALISFYSAIKYQDVFSKVGVFSPSFWFSDEVYTYVSNMGKKHKMNIYLLGGEQESANLINDMKKMVSTLKRAGFEDSEIKMVTHPDGQHSEWYWRREFKNAYLWLFNKNTLSSSFFLRKNNLILYPNPVIDKFNILNSHKLVNANLLLYDISGKLKYSTSVAENDIIQLKGLSQGLYFCKIIKDGKLILTQKLIKSGY